MNEHLGFCPECGNVKENPKWPLCSNCYKQYKTEFTRVKNYLREHPGATVVSISKEMDIHVDRVLQFMRDGLIQAKS